ncbi:hypothetical protein N5J43_24455 [Pseudomonas nicosulfuronedens]|uniref:Uncharacterized protein n=1 Tax=Pseudomonas nicosulfuronedens TaxID=2571105 RepID=A0A5R9QT02_9PSED|nr:hypothetical protein [Pseudomonas nicosulfuronedens]MDH1011342.1 hypothetical protein [Pseudomonas nicosulfuronedens]MDH1982117.1 hypothetical protein [Pseudomonas nicosulfuronedens]MDH2029706.1 hypothetical protein [Pseudomonas nicosulfuronedens]TLX72943.1 hypothetical protein FAS41_22030 [Pseudomonas nicosulfuronedens]
MSQNANTLMLFFKEQGPHELCVLSLVNLMRGDQEKSRGYQQRLGVDLGGIWEEVWFNQQFSAQPEYIRLDFDTSVRANLPLALLESLFEQGLRAAVIEVFHSQVGETQRHHFLDGKLVNRSDLYHREPFIEPIVSVQLDARHEDGEEDTSVCVTRPVPLRQLIEEEREHEENAKVLVEGIAEIAKVARQTGVGPGGVIKTGLVLWQMAKGLLHAVILTVLALVFFKGFWMWLGLGVLLAVILPLLYGWVEYSDLTGKREEPEAADGAD